MKKEIKPIKTEKDTENPLIPTWVGFFKKPNKTWVGLKKTNKTHQCWFFLPDLKYTEPRNTRALLYIPALATRGFSSSVVVLLENCKV